MSVFDVKETVAVELKGPNGEETPIKVFVRPSYSKEVQKAIEVSHYHKLQKLADLGVDRLSPEQAADFTSDSGERFSVAVIADWDFGGDSFGALEANAECSEENKLYFIRHPAYRAFIGDQLMEASGNRANFIPAKSKPAPKRSAKT